MEMFLIFALGSIGLTHIIVDSKFFEGIRNLVDKHLPKDIAYMIHCYQCAGFWAGVLCGSICFWHLLSIYGYGILMKCLFMLVCGWASSFLSNLAATYLNYLDSQTILKE